MNKDETMNCQKMIEKIQQKITLFYQKSKNDMIKHQ
jgi:hypothetical protein